MMPENQTWELLINAGAVVLAALAVLGCALAIVLTSRSSGKIQRDLIKILNQQMDNETTRDGKEDRRQDEAERHNQRLESLLENLIKKEDERYIKIGDALESISQSQEVIRKGVEDMNANEKQQGFDEILNLLVELKNSIDDFKGSVDRLVEYIAPSPAESADTPKPPGEKTQPLATPGSTVKEERQAKSTKSKKTEFSATIPPFDKTKKKH